ncbi:YgfZ/GcvT domain-containing protein, partial [Microbacterium koreense]
MNVFASVPGAVIDDAGLQHLGNPLAEQRALASGAAVAPLGDRSVLAVSGEDRLTWLDSLTSQALARLAPGVGTEFLVLDPQGRIEHAASVIDDGVTTWLIADAADAEGLRVWLTRMRFRLRVDPQDAGDRFAVVGGTPEAVSSLAASPNAVPLVWRDPWPGVADGGWGYATPATHPGAHRAWAEAIVGVDTLAELASAAARGEVALAG